LEFTDKGHLENGSDDGHGTPFAVSVFISNFQEKLSIFEAAKQKKMAAKPQPKRSVVQTFLYDTASACA